MARATTTKKGRTTPSKPERDAKQETVDQIIAALEAGTVIWHKDWHSTAGDMPTSLSTRKRYGGSNILVLWFAMLANGWTEPYFGTYDEMAERAGLVKIPRPGGKGHFWVSPDLPDGTRDPQPRGVRKGEKATVIVRPISGTVPVKDEAGNVVLDKTGKPKLKTWRKLVVHNVYNVAQCAFPEGCKGYPQAPVVNAEVDPIQAAEDLVAGYLADGPSLGWGGDQAYYQAGSDHVQMPPRHAFETPEGLYATLYHELTHSTGHDSREAREGIAKGTFAGFGSPCYSFEELVAELGAAMLCALAGIEQKAVFDNSAAYIAHWLKALKEDKNLIFEAASQADKAVERILGHITTTNQKEES